MKLLEDVYLSIEYMYSEFQLLACPFCFFITFCKLVDPQMIHFELFYHPVRKG